ncbi:MAG: calcium-binding protein [Paracoccaceae bacterium]
MQVVNMSVSSGGRIGETISEQHHGVGMLFQNDDLAQGSDFRAVIEATSSDVIRYPGGTVAEEYFDLGNPNQNVTQNIIDVKHGADSVRTQAVVGLDEYLEYTAEIGASQLICLPTYRYFDLTTGGLVSGAEAEIKAFVTELLTDRLGPVEHVTLELGNEFYQDRFNWSDAQFGALQAQMGEWIDAQATALGLRDDLTLLAQAGRSAEENQMLASYFTDPNGPGIDGVVTHFYGTNSSGNTLAIGGGIGRRLEEINTVWSDLLGPDFDLAVTEWNVGESGETTTLINGIMRSAPLLRIYAEMIEHGVDLAAIWSAQTNGPAGLSQTEGRDRDLSPTGLFMAMLADATEGSVLLDPTDSFKLENSAGADLGYVYSFEKDQEAVTFFSSGIDDTIDLNIDITRFYTPEAYVYATVLGAAPDTEGTEYWAEAGLTQLTRLPISGGPGNWTFNHILQPFETLKLHIVHSKGVNIQGDTQTTIIDDLTGSFYADALAGGMGDDILDGRAGSDTLGGGSGDDVLLGKSGADDLMGGSGNDSLYGGHGDDVMRGSTGDDLMRGNKNDDSLHGGDGTDKLYGGAGDDALFGDLDRDFLRGDAGNDTLDGGLGNDNLTGGAGADVFVFRDESYGFDRVKDFEVGLDKIDLTDFGMSFSQVEALMEENVWGLRIDFGDRNVMFFEDLVQSDLTADQFLL